MSKTRLSRKEISRLKKKAHYTAELQKATYWIELTKAIPNQAVLNAALLPEEDEERRRACFEKMVPYLSFPNPQFPTKQSVIVADTSMSRIIRP